MLKRVVVAVAATALLGLGSGQAFADTSWGDVAPQGRTTLANTSWGDVAPQGGTAATSASVDHADHLCC
jgi:hypothetical protein